MKLFLDDTRYFLSDEFVDLSIPITNHTDNVNAWHCEPVKIEPVVAEGFIGDVNQGAPVNFRNITINPHGNGTHTECVGHISKENITINQCLNEFHFIGQVVSISPTEMWNDEFNTTDWVITKNSILENFQPANDTKVLIIRTLPNLEEKMVHQYSNTNPAYFDTEAMEFINQMGIEHLMVDLPSVDREMDHGKLACHHIFWNYPKQPSKHKTISELLYIPTILSNGTYLIHLQIISLESDASPSKILAHKIYPA
jgi:kynurenine formamidase